MAPGRLAPGAALHELGLRDLVVVSPAPGKTSLGFETSTAVRGALRIETRSGAHLEFPLASEDGLSHRLDLDGGVPVGWRTWTLSVVDLAGRPHDLDLRVPLLAHVDRLLRKTRGASRSPSPDEKRVDALGEGEGWSNALQLARLMPWLLSDDAVGLDRQANAYLALDRVHRRILQERVASGREYPGEFDTGFGAFYESSRSQLMGAAVYEFDHAVKWTTRTDPHWGTVQRERLETEVVIPGSIPPGSSGELELVLDRKVEPTEVVVEASLNGRVTLRFLGRRESPRSVLGSFHGFPGGALQPGANRVVLRVMNASAGNPINGAEVRALRLHVGRRPAN